MLAQLENVSRYFPEVDLLAGINVQVNDGDHIGLVGPNGSGKSQLLGIMAGAIAPDAGRVNYQSKIRIGKLDQEVNINPQHTVMEETLTVFADLLAMERGLGELEESISATGRTQAEVLLKRYSELKDRFEREDGYSFRQKAASVLQGLGFAPEELAMSCRILSGGQLNRLGLAKLLLRPADLLLLDEPTNHLDLPAVEWLEEFLQAWNRAFVVVSHDRYFLDRVVTQVWEIAKRRVNSFPGNYSHYQKEKVKRLEQQRREYENQRMFIEKTQDFIRRNIYGQKTKQAKSRRKMLEKVERIERPTEDQRRIRLDLSSVARSSDTVLVLENLAVGYSKPLACLPFEMTVVRGDRIGVLGENGTGKTTMLRTLLGQIAPLSGHFHWGRNVAVGYFDQKMETLAGSPMQELRSLDPLALEGDLRGFLAKFGFTDDDVFKPLTALSGGEKNRLLLARLIYGKYNVLLLDEPTNHLDIASREELEEALETFPGTILVVSHDRYFLNRIVTRVMVFQEGTVENFYGDYSSWATQTALKARGTTRGDREGLESAPAKTGKNERLRSLANPADRAELSKNERFRLEQQFAALEAEIAAQEARLSEVEGVLQSPAPGMAAAELTRLGREYESVKTNLDGLLERWAEMGSRLEGQGGNNEAAVQSEG